MLMATRWTLRVLNWLNWGLGVPIVIIGIMVGHVFPEQLLAAATNAGSEAPGAILAFVQFTFIAVAPVIWLAHLIFSRLIAMIDSVPTGQIFSLANAARLRTVAWALLGTQIIDLITGIHMQILSETSGEYLGWSFGMTGWVTVLLLFLLSGIFREGAAMREELEGTV